VVVIAPLGFALETQTRPIYDPGFFNNRTTGDSTVVHELAHQWYGDSLAVRHWRQIWLNEGFATYAEWLWSEREGLGTAQEQFDALASIPAGDGFWRLRIGNPGVDHLFDGQVYDRGAMTLHALRLTIGDDAFFTLLRRWAAEHASGNVTTRQFVALAEQISGRDLTALFDAWLFTPSRPVMPAATLAAGTTTVAPPLAARPAGRPLRP
jgi:aminopeptidase N